MINTTKVNKLNKLIEKYYQDNFKNKKIIPGKDIIPASGKVFDERELIYGVQAVLDGWWTEGRFSRKFEKKLCQFLKVKNCILVNSGSSANLLAISALKSFRLGKRRLLNADEVITTAVNFPTTVNPLIINNLVPVFVDVNLGDYNADIGQIKKAISKKTKAIILAHTLGNPFNIDEVIKICKKYNLWLVEDNCDALGSLYKGKLTGSFGDISTLSFYPAHQITTGEGGAVLTSNSLLARIIKSMRDWGRDCWCKTGQNNACKKRFSWQLGDLPFGFDHKYIYSELGFNLKLTDMQASIGLAQLKKLKPFIKKRQANFAYLYKKFQNLKDYFILPKWDNKTEASWFGFPLTILKESKIQRNKLLQFLFRKKIDSRLLFAGNILKQPYFKNYKLEYSKVENLTKSDLIMKNSFWLGVYPVLEKKHLDYIVKTIKKYLNI